LTVLICAMTSIKTPKAMREVAASDTRKKFRSTASPAIYIFV